MFRKEDGEIALKMSAIDADEIQELIRFLESKYRFVSRSRLVENDRDDGYHLFCAIAPQEEGD